MSLTKEESTKNLRSARSNLAKAQFKYWEASEKHELLFGDKALGEKIKQEKMDPRRAKREKAKTARDNKKSNSTAGGVGKKPVEKKANTEAKVKKVAKVINKKNVRASAPEVPSNWNVETDCKGNEIHGDGCKGTTDANKARAKADTRHEGKMFPTCKACKNHIAKRRREERELQAYEKEAREAQPEPMEIDGQEEEEAEDRNSDGEDEVNEEEEQDE